eukprot:675289_1
MQTTCYSSSWRRQCRQIHNRFTSIRRSHSNSHREPQKRTQSDVALKLQQKIEQYSHRVQSILTPDMVEYHVQCIGTAVAHDIYRAESSDLSSISNTKSQPWIDVHNNRLFSAVTLSKV